MPASPSAAFLPAAPWCAWTAKGANGPASPTGRAGWSGPRKILPTNASPSWVRMENPPPPWPRWKPGWWSAPRSGTLLRLWTTAARAPSFLKTAGWFPKPGFPPNGPCPLPPMKLPRSSPCWGIPPRPGCSSTARRSVPWWWMSRMPGNRHRPSGISTEICPTRPWI